MFANALRAYPRPARTLHALGIRMLVATGKPTAPHNITETWSLKLPCGNPSSTGAACVCWHALDVRRTWSQPDLLPKHCFGKLVVWWPTRQISVALTANPMQYATYWAKHKT